MVLGLSMVFTMVLGFSKVFLRSFYDGFRFTMVFTMFFSIKRFFC